MNSQFVSRIPSSLLFLLAAGFLGCNGCQSDVEVDFKINGQEFPDMGDKVPEDPSECARVYPGDEVFIADLSAPYDKVGTRFWDVDGDGTWDPEYADSSAFSVTFRTGGYHRIVLAVNSEDNQKALYVWVDNQFQELEWMDPQFEFISPARSTTVDKARLSLSIEGQNLMEGDNVTLLLNGRPVSFNQQNRAGTTRIEAKQLMLESGENSIEVGTTDDSGRLQHTAELTVFYEKPKSVVQSAPKPSAPAPRTQPASPSRSTTQTSRKKDTPPAPPPTPENPPKKEQQPAQATAEEEGLDQEPHTETEQNSETEEKESPTISFDSRYTLKARSEYSRTSLTGIEVSQFSRLYGKCAMDTSGKPFVVDITDIQSPFLIESIEVALAPGLMAQDFEVKLQCLNPPDGRGTKREYCSTAYDQEGPDPVTLYDLSKHPLIPGNDYRMKIIPGEGVALNFINTERCTDKVASSPLATFTYQEGQCPLFNVSLKH